MRHYLVETYHGPLIFTKRRHSWIIEAPSRPPEIYRGAIPMECLKNAIEIEGDRAMRILGREAVTLWGEDWDGARAS